MRAAAASTNAHSRRWASATAVATAASTAGHLLPLTRPRWTPTSRSARGPYRAHLHATEGRGDLAGDGQGFVEVGGIDDVVAADHLFRFGEGSVGHGDAPPAIAADRGRRAAGMETVAAPQRGGVVANEPRVGLHCRVVGLRVGRGPRRLVVVDE